MTIGPPWQNLFHLNCGRHGGPEGKASRLPYDCAQIVSSIEGAFQGSMFLLTSENVASMPDRWLRAMGNILGMRQMKVCPSFVLGVSSGAFSVLLVQFRRGRGR